MSLQLQSGLEAELTTMLVGKTIRGVRPTHDNGSVPDVNLMLTDDTTLVLSVKDGVYFEGCMINTLRKAQPITDVLLTSDGADHKLEIRARTFPLLELKAVNKNLDPDTYPFEVRVREQAGA